MKNPTRVFISYRRDDTRHVAARIYDWVEGVYGKGNVFFDVSAIPPGVNFEKLILDRLTGCRVVLVIIGPEWERLLKEKNPPDAEERDYVALELEAAARLDLLVIPVLIDGTIIPEFSSTSPKLAYLRRINAARIRTDETFKEDMNRLLHEIEYRLKDTNKLMSIDMFILEENWKKTQSKFKSGGSIAELMAMIVLFPAIYVPAVAAIAFVGFFMFGLGHLFWSDRLYIQAIFMWMLLVGVVVRCQAFLRELLKAPFEVISSVKSWIKVRPCRLAYLAEKASLTAKASANEPG